MKLGDTPEKQQPPQQHQPQPQQPPQQQHQPVEGNAYSSMSIIGAPPRQIFPDTFTGVKESDFTAVKESDGVAMPPPMPPPKYEFADFKVRYFLSDQGL